MSEQQISIENEEIIVVFVTYGFLQDEQSISRTFILADTFYRIFPSNLPVPVFAFNEMYDLDEFDDDLFEEEDALPYYDHRIIDVFAARQILTTFLVSDHISDEQKRLFSSLEREFLNAAECGYRECVKILHCQSDDAGDDSVGR